MKLTTGEIAERLGGTLRGDSGIEISGLAEAAEAGPGQITFAEEERFFEKASEGGASAILVATTFECPGKALIQVENVRVGWAQLLSWFYPEPEFSAGVQAGATVASSAEVHPTAHVGPGCVIGAHVEIGAQVVLTGGVHIGEHCQIGEGTKLFPNVIIYPRTRIGARVRIHAGTVVGSDGYGYVFNGAKHQKINQIGGVILEDDVELGANVTIDRGALGDTIIGEGSKIDNLVQIAHNVVVGKHCIIISQTGIAGSTKIGDYTIIAGQVGIAGHLKIGSRVTIAAQSGVMRDIPDGQKVFGSPAQGDRDFKRQLLGLQQLPDLIKRFRRLEAQSGRGAGDL